VDVGTAKVCFRPSLYTLPVGQLTQWSEWVAKNIKGVLEMGVAARPKKWLATLWGFFSFSHHRTPWFIVSRDRQFALEGGGGLAKYAVLGKNIWLTVVCYTVSCLGVIPAQNLQRIGRAGHTNTHSHMTN
jgi:hypothetical protein